MAPFPFLRTALLMLAAALAAAPAAAQKVGVSGAVNPDVNSTPPGGGMRRLVVGQEVVYNEHITTTEKGQTQILFLDESSMTVGPNSDVTIDKFVYDPKTGTGQMSVSAGKGVLRYVGGKLSKQEDAVTMRAGSALIGIRGGALLATVQPNGGTEVIFIYGKGATVTGQSGCSQTLRRPSFEVKVAAGDCPTSPALAPPSAISGILAQLDGIPGGTGGARTAPTNATVAASGISNTISGNVTASVQQAVQTHVLFAPPQINVGAIQSNLSINTVQATAQPQIAQSQSGKIAPPARPAPPTTGLGAAFEGGFGATNPATPLQAGLTNGTLATQLPQGLLSFPLASGSTTLNANGSNTTSPFGPVTGTTFLSPDNSFFYANLAPVNGTASPLFVAGGSPVSTSFLAPTGTTRILAFELPQPPTNQQSFFLSNPLPFVSNEDVAVDPNATVSPLFLVAPATTAIGEASTPSMARTLQASLSIVGIGPGQQSVLAVNIGSVTSLQSGGAPVITGVLRGTIGASGEHEGISSAVSSLVDGGGNSLYGTNAGISGFVLDQSQLTVGANGKATGPVAALANEADGLSLNASNLESYNFVQPAVALNGTGSPPSGVGLSRSNMSLTGFFGGTMATTAHTPILNGVPGSGGSYPITGTVGLSTDATLNTISATFTSNPLSAAATGGATSIVMSFGGMQSTFVDDTTFGAAENPNQPQQINGQTLVVAGDPSQGGKLYLVSSGAIPPPGSFLPPGSNGNLCNPGTCQYLQWGYWGGDLQSGASSGNLGRVDHGDINFWVAGIQTPVSQMPTVGSGSYAGTALGSVVNQGNMYVASGGFAANYNFGTGAGTASLINFDKNINVTIAAPGNPAQVGKNTFGVTGTTGNFTGSLQGGFFGTGPNAASEIGGNFSLQSNSGPSYLAAGIFGGKLTGPIH
jgi:hypothetical protein